MKTAGRLYVQKLFYFLVFFYLSLSFMLLGILEYIYLCSLIPNDGGPPKHFESLMDTSPVVCAFIILQYYTFVHCHNVLQNYLPFYIYRIRPQNFTMSERLLFLTSK